MGRGLEEVSVTGKTDSQVKLVDTEKGFNSHFRSGRVLKLGYEKRFNIFLLKSITTV